MYLTLERMENCKFTVDCFLKKLFFFSVIILLTLNCAKVAPPVPLSRGGRMALEGEERLFLVVSGTINKHPDSVGVQRYNKGSWINLQFREEIDTTSAGIKLISLNGSENPFIKEWNFSEGKTELILKPGERLNYNTVYMLKISGAEGYNLMGKHLDLDRDGVAGEPVEDDLIRPFVTLKVDGSRGEWPSDLTDNISPFVAAPLMFLIDGDNTEYIWTDVKLVIYLYDYTWGLADTSVKVQAVDSSTISEDAFEIINERSQKKMAFESVTYISDSLSTDFGRVIIKPSQDFEPGTSYTLKVSGGISDTHGNKLGRKDSVIFTRKFKTFSCNHDSSKCFPDTVAPRVLSWKNLGPAFEVVFSEIIDVSSVTDSSVYLAKVDGDLYIRNECGQSFVRFVTSGRSSVSGYTGFVTGEVMDLAGNRLGKTEEHYFAERID